MFCLKIQGNVYRFIRTSHINEGEHLNLEESKTRRRGSFSVKHVRIKVITLIAHVFFENHDILYNSLPESQSNGNFDTKNNFNQWKKAHQFYSCFVSGLNQIWFR